MKYTLFLTLFILSSFYAQDSAPTVDDVKKFIQSRTPGSISFDGMFAGIEKLGPQTLDHLNTLISDPDFPLQYRIHIPRAMGELGDKNAIPLLKGYVEDIFMEDQIKGEIEYALYALGDPQVVEGVNNFLNKIQADLKQVTENPPSPEQFPPEELQKQVVAAYLRMREVSYRTKKYEVTCIAYEALNKMFPQATEWYNWACTLSLAGRLDEAVAKLKTAVEDPKNRFRAEDVESDGDLKNLHQHPEFIALMKKLRENPPQTVTPPENKEEKKDF